MAEAAGAGALEDAEFLHRTLELNARSLRFLTESLRALGFAVVSSNANFIMLPLKDAAAAEALCGDLMRQGVIIRHLEPFGLPHCVRISTGTDEENQIAVEAIEKQMKQTRENRYAPAR